jgi:hypothetical protein
MYALDVLNHVLVLTMTSYSDTGHKPQSGTLYLRCYSDIYMCSYHAKLTTCSNLSIFTALPPTVAHAQNIPGQCKLEGYCAFIYVIKVFALLSPV